MRLPKSCHKYPLYVNKMEIVPTEKIPPKEEIKDVPTDNLMQIYKVCLEMENICRRFQGIGLSAVQVGIPWKLFIVRYSPLTPQEYFGYYINCDYAPLVDVNQKHMQSVEGCLSLRKKNGSSRQFIVDRYPKIKVVGKVLKAGDKLSLEDINQNFDDPKDIYTVVMQHECDHNLGILISHVGIEMEMTNVKQKTS